MRNRSNAKDWTYRELKTKSGHLETKDFSIVNFCWDKGGDGDVVPGLKKIEKHIKAHKLIIKIIRSIRVDRVKTQKGGGETKSNKCIREAFSRMGHQHVVIVTTMTLVSRSG